MKIEIKKIDKDVSKLKYNDLILLYDKYIGRLTSDICKCGLSKKGYWIEYQAGCKGGTYYSLKDLENKPPIKLFIEGYELTGDCLLNYLERLNLYEIYIDSELVSFEHDNEEVTNIIYPESELFQPEVDYEIEDMYMGGIGELSHICKPGKITYVTDKFFIVSPVYDNVDDIKVNKSDWHWF